MPIAPNTPFNLYNFRQVIGDPARPYLFLINMPEIGTQQTMTCLARSTTLPGFSVNEIPIPFQGVEIKIGGTPKFKEWEVEFFCDEVHALRRLFFTWQSLIYDIGTGLQGHSNTYKSDQVGAAQLDRTGDQVAIYGFVGAWPKDVGDIKVGQDMNGTFETFSVQFAIDYFILVDQFGTQTTAQSFVRNVNAPQISRGTPPPAGHWPTPFTPQ